MTVSSHLVSRSLAGVSTGGRPNTRVTNRLEEQDVSVLALHLLQASLVDVSILMFQQVLEEPGWLGRMLPEDLRALSPLIYHHLNPHGTFELDMAKRPPIDKIDSL